VLAGSNDSTVALRVVRGDEEELRECLGVYLGYAVLGEINTRTWPSRLGVSLI
jgi:hypothetical protein